MPRALSKSRAAIVGALLDCPRTASELADLTEANIEQVRRDLRALERKGAVRALSVRGTPTKLWMPGGGDSDAC